MCDIALWFASTKRNGFYLKHDLNTKSWRSIVVSDCPHFPCLKQCRHIAREYVNREEDASRPYETRIFIKHHFHLLYVLSESILLGKQL